MAAHSSLSSIALATLIFFVAAAITQVADATDKTDGSGNEDIRPRSRDLVVEACKNISQGDLLDGKLSLKEETCISVLRSNNQSSVAMGHGDLVAVALDLLSNRSSDAATKISGVLHAHTVRDIWTERALRYCDADYMFMVKMIPTCRAVFFHALEVSQDKEPVFWVQPSDALNCMDRLGMATEDCRIWLSYKDYKQTEEFETVVRYAGFAWGLMEISLDYVDEDTAW